MSSGESVKRHDFVIFGASGFTGQFVVDEVARLAETEGLSWAIAGRKMDKLQKVLEESEKRTGKNIEKTPILIADTSSNSSILEMCQKAKVLLNCVGPYRFHGEQVVRACIEAGAHHMDISGEPEFLENVQLLYSTKAREAGVYIIGSCGFDSIPAEMGVEFTRSKFEGDLNSVEGFMKMQTGPEGGVINYGTYETAVHSIATTDNLPVIRKQLFPNPLPRSKHRIQKRSAVFKSDDSLSWCFPFMGSDKSVVHRTQRYLYDVSKTRPIQYSPYFCVEGLFRMFVLVVLGSIFGIMAKFGPTRALLLRYPELFTAGLVKRGGPSKAQIEGSSFSISFFGSGYSNKLDDPEQQHESPPDKKIHTQVVGPEPGYVTTPICIVQAALVLIKEKSSLPKQGGVYTPASAFRETTLIERLEKSNIKFQVISSD